MNTRILFSVVIFFAIACGQPVIAAGDDGPQQSKTGPTPPPGVAEKVPELGALAQVQLFVPGYSWRHGCGPTAVGMVIGYYDGLGYHDLIPGDAYTQTNAVNQAIASGGDSSSPNPPGSEKHYEDYSRPEDSFPNLLTDDYITEGRPAHGDNCIGDYMDTSKSTRNNYYGWSWSSDVGPSFVSYVNQQNPDYGPSYQQYQMGSTLTWSVLTTEINNDRPMVFLVDTDADGGTDHFVTIVGYRDTPSQQYGCLDTWPPADVVRWCDFEQMSGGQPWGIWGGWSFSLSPGENHDPVLSNPRVYPMSGTEYETEFEFMVDYYDADGDVPDYKNIYLSDGRIVPMTFKEGSGSASNGTYHYTTDWLSAEDSPYSYWFFFSDTRGGYDMTPWQSGPWVYTEGCGVELKVEVSGGPVTNNIEICFGYGPDLMNLETQCWQAPELPQNLWIDSGQQLMFTVSVECIDHTFVKWEFRDDEGNLVRESTASGYGFILLSGNIHATAYLSYTPQNHTISGTVLQEGSSLVPGGVDLTLSSPVETLQRHTDDGNFSFTGVKGGVPVTVTPSAPGYAFTPASLVYENLCNDHTGESITAYSSDAYVPTTTFISVPPEVSEESSVSFSWIGEDDVSAPPNLLYQYKLDGVDIDWSGWVSDTSKSYDIANGVYRFWVRAKDEAGNYIEKDESAACYSFVVNAAPRVISAVRINRSVWASRITLEMPASPNHPNDIFILLPEHAGTSDPELLPVTIHLVDDINACGGNEIVSDELSLITRITETKSGWQVTLPESIPLGQSVQYDIVWGKIKYFGWQEYVSVPDGFPNGGTVQASYLDDSLRIWRSASKFEDHGTGNTNDDDGWMYMDACNQHGMVIGEDILRFVRGESWGGVAGTSTEFPYSRVFKAGSNICYIWNDYRYEYHDPGDYDYRRYGLQIFDSTGNTVNSLDGTYYDRTWYALPTQLVHGSMWILAEESGTPDSAWFLVLNENGSEVISKTVFDTISKNYSDLDVEKAQPLGTNVVFLWERSWETDEDYCRQEIAYEVWDTSGSVVKDRTTLSQTLLPDSVEDDDEYIIDSILADDEGKVWISYYRYNYYQGGEIGFFYSILGTDGNVWKGPITTPNQRSFNFCDKDGYIWATENGQFLALNPDDTTAVGPRTGAWTPNQEVSLIAASAGTTGYRLYDRWSPQTIGIDVPPGVNASSMDLFDLNLWGNELHTADPNLTKDSNSVWSYPGQFTGHTSVDMSDVLDEGLNILTMTQNDFLGGQVLVTFPYIVPGDINGDGKVNFKDLKILAQQWLQPPGTPSADIVPDDIVNFQDFAVLAENWLAGCWK